MKSTFFYKSHSSIGREESIEADMITFVPGYIVFQEHDTNAFGKQIEGRIIKAVRSSAVAELREEVNENDKTGDA